MEPCPNCDFVNRAGIWVCEQCSHNLLGNATLPTRLVNTRGEASIATGRLKTALLTPIDNIFLTIPEVANPIPLSRNQALVLGRVNPFKSKQPDLDLTPNGCATGRSRFLLSPALPIVR